MTTKTHTIWVCGNCIQHAANGECGGCDDQSHDRKPLGLLEGQEASVGLAADEHDSDCDIHDGDQCDQECEDKVFSWGQCTGCGTARGGSRHAMTVWDKEQA